MTAGLEDGPQSARRVGQQFRRERERLASRRDVGQYWRRRCDGEGGVSGACKKPVAFWRQWATESARSTDTE